MSTTKKGKSKGKDITSQLFASTTEVLPTAPRYGVGGEGSRGGYNRSVGRGGYANQYPSRGDSSASSSREGGPAEYSWTRGSNAQPAAQGRVSTGVGEAPQRSSQPQKSLGDFEWNLGGKTQPQPQAQPQRNGSLPQRDSKDNTPQKSLNDFDWSLGGKAQPQPSVLPQREPKEATSQKSLTDFEWSLGGKSQPQPQAHSSAPRESREATSQKSLTDYEWSLGGKAQPQPQALPSSHSESYPSTHSNTSRAMSHNSSVSDMDWSRKESQPPPPPPSSSSSIDNPLPSDDKPFHHSKPLHSERRDLDWNTRGLPQPKMEDYNNRDKDTDNSNDRWTSVGVNGKPRRNEFRNDDRREFRRDDDRRRDDRNEFRRDERRGLLTRDGIKGNWRKDNETIDKKEIEKPVEKQEEKPVEIKEVEKPTTTTTTTEKEVEKPKEKEMPSLEELKEQARQKNENVPSIFLEPSSKKQSATTKTTKPVIATTTTTPVKSKEKDMPSVEELKEQARLRNLNQKSSFLAKPLKDLPKLFYYNDLNNFDESRKRRINTSISELITNRKNDDTIEDIKELQLKEIERIELIKEIIMDLCDYNKPEDHKLIYELINRLYKEKLIGKCDIFCGLSIINNNKEDLKCDIPKIEEYYTDLYKYLAKNELIEYEPISKTTEEIDKYYGINKYFNGLKGEELTAKLINDGYVDNAIVIFEIFLSHLINISNEEDKQILCKDYEGVYLFPLLDDDNKYGNVLKRLIGNVNKENKSDIKEIQLKCIDLVCKYSSLLNHPTEWCESLFMNLYDKYVISEESFKEWKNKTTIEEKNKVLDDCSDFFEWLETAEYEEE